MIIPTFNTWLKRSNVDKTLRLKDKSTVPALNQQPLRFRSSDKTTRLRHLNNCMITCITLPQYDPTHM